MIGEDGYIATGYHTLWTDKKLRRKFKIISEADFYFPSDRLAVFATPESFIHPLRPKRRTN